MKSAYEPISGFENRMPDGTIVTLNGNELNVRRPDEQGKGTTIVFGPGVRICRELYPAPEAEESAA